MEWQKEEVRREKVEEDERVFKKRFRYPKQKKMKGKKSFLLL